MKQGLETSIRSLFPGKGATRGTKNAETLVKRTTRRTYIVDCQVLPFQLLQVKTAGPVR